MSMTAPGQRGSARIIWGRVGEQSGAGVNEIVHEWSSGRGDATVPWLQPCHQGQVAHAEESA